MHLSYKLRCFFYAKNSYMEQNFKEGGNVLCNQETKNQTAQAKSRFTSLAVWQRPRNNINLEKEKEETWQQLIVLK